MFSWSSIDLQRTPLMKCVIIAMRCRPTRLAFLSPKVVAADVVQQFKNDHPGVILYLAYAHTDVLITSINLTGVLVLKGQIRGSR